MKCIICGTEMEYYFTKIFNVCGLTDVDYWKCSNCGFCASKTHFDMTDEQWTVLNNNFHSESHYREDNPYNRNQRYFNQALMLFLMAKHALVDRGAWLDWGCGIGSVALLLKDYFDIKLLTYDKYFTPQINAINEDILIPRTFDLVMNTAVFEHVRDRNTLDEIESYVSGTGCFAIHTLIPESVPKDPDWMYLLPVHCAFHTNRSMQILMDAWGYNCSVYNEHSKMWVLFRQDADLIRSGVAEINRTLGWEYLHFKLGFMDYWK
jgi:hypothetical protein